jgi:hypothetical protein
VVTHVVTRGVTHVSTAGSPEWITVTKYARRYARHVNVALLRMVEAGLIYDSWIPKLKIAMVRRIGPGGRGGQEEPPTFVAPKLTDAV